jgi:hypothetical protein
MEYQHQALKNAIEMEVIDEEESALNVVVVLLYSGELS